MRKLWQRYCEHRLLVNCALLAGLFFVNCFWGGMTYGVYPLLLLLVYFDSLPNAVTYLLFAVPFFELNVHVSVAMYLACVLVFMVRFYVVQYLVEKKRPQNYRVLIMIGVLVAYCCLPIGPYNLNRVAKICLLLIVFAILGMIGKAPHIFRLRLNTRVVALALVVAAAYALLGTLSPYLRQNAYFQAYVLGGNFIRFKALFVQPNNLAMVCEIVGAIFGYLIISQQGRLVDYILLFAVTILGLLTFSKTLLILLGIVYLAMFIWLLRVDLGRTVVVALVLVAIAFCACAVNPRIITVYVGRFVDGFASSQSFTDFMDVLTTARYNLWVTYGSYLLTHPLALLFGRGLGAAALHGWATLSPHNFFLAMIYQLGLAGTGLFIAVVVVMVRGFLKGKTKRLHPAICVPLIICGLLLCVEDFILYIF